MSLARAKDLNVEVAAIDARRGYGEIRYRAWGLLDDRPYALAFTVVGGRLRAISLRRAHLKEYRRHVS